MTSPSMPSRRRAVIAVTAAVAVVATVTALVVAFAIIPLPAFPSLRDEPDASIPGTVAFGRWDDGYCWYVVPAGGGEDREVLCREDFGGEPGVQWTADGSLAMGQWDFGEYATVLIDPATGVEVGRYTEPFAGEPVERSGPGVAERARRADGAVVSARSVSDAGRAAVTIRYPDGTTSVLLDVEGPRDYRIEFAQWSPDGSWVLASDSEGRVLVLRAEGDPAPRILVADVYEYSPPAWYIPGNATYTWQPPEG